jgi:hypothetical protein
MKDLEKRKSYGLLLNQDIKLHRNWFRQMTKLIGINCEYRAPKKDKSFSEYGELESNYQKPIIVGCILDQHPDQKSMKKLGWVSELDENSLLLHVPYDLPDLQVGALFTLPSGIDEAENRIFRVISMQNIMIYPASITCEIAPEYNTDTELNEIYRFEFSDFNVLKDNENDD